MPRRLHALIGEAGTGDGPEAAREAGVVWEVAASPQSFLQALEPGSSDLALMSFGVDGVDAPLVERVIQLMGGGDRVLLTAPGASLELAVLVRRSGAGSLLREPLVRSELVHELRRRAPVRDGIPLGESPPSSSGTHLVGSGEAMAAVIGTIAEVGDTPSAVLVTGESGTGKELVARAIHWASPRRERPFVAINCAAIPEHLLESEFFGHEKGAFTGAVARKRGRFELAHEGTLFLDEVGDMQLILQAKILRALEEGVVERVGSEGSLAVDVRVVAASNRSLEERVASGEFREDLYYRLAGARIHVPSLRERMEDLEELAVHFAAHFSQVYGRRLEGIDREVVRRLSMHAWPGNVRELRNVMDRAVRGCRGGWVRPEDLVMGPDAPRVSPSDARPDQGYPVTASLEEVEREHIMRVLDHTGGAIGAAAEILGVHRNTLRRRIDRYDLRGSVAGE